MQKILAKIQRRRLMSRIGGMFFAFIALIMLYTSSAIAAGYTCNTKVYVSCNEGYYLSNCDDKKDTSVEQPTQAGNSCLSCPDATKYKCDGGLKCPTTMSITVTCSGGKYIAKGAISCDKTCEAGYKCKGGNYTISPNGAESVTGREACSGTAEYQNETGQSSCKAVGDGYYKNGNTAVQACDTGWYCKSGVRTQCGANTTTATTTATASTDCVCVAGRYKSGNSCEPCAKGTYKSTIGNDSCSSCTANATTDSTGSTVKTACKCNAGYSGDATSGSCTACNAGYYKAGAGNVNCTACAAGTYQTSTGQASCNSCSPIGEGFNAWVSTDTGNTKDDCEFTCKETHTISGRTCAECSKTAACPSGYSGTYDSCAGETPQAKCTITCQPGTYVAEPKGACVELNSSGKYIGSNTVYYESTSSLSTCPNNGASAKGASYITDCYGACPDKPINNGTATYSSGGMYYNSSAKSYSDNRCKYTVNCNARYGAGNTDNTTNPTCTECSVGQFSPGGPGVKCETCTNWAGSGVSEYVSNGTAADNCAWRCSAGRYKSGSTCPPCPMNIGDGSVVATSSNESTGSNQYANDTIQGCYIADNNANGERVQILDDKGWFQYKHSLISDAAPTYCKHK